MTAIDDIYKITKLYDEVYILGSSNTIYGNNENVDEIEEDYIYKDESTYFFMKVPQTNILTSAIHYILKANALFALQSNKLLKKSNYSLDITIRDRFRSDLFESSDLIQITSTSSYYLDITYFDNKYISNRYLFDYEGYKFSSNKFIKTWFASIEKVLEIQDTLTCQSDFFYHYCFEVFCGKIVKAYFISGFEDDIVYDLMTEKEITQEEYRQATQGQHIMLQSLSPGIYGNIY